MNTAANASAMGSLLVALKALELELRRYLAGLDSPDADAGQSSMPPVAVGATFASSVLTNQEPFGALIEEFNRSLQPAERTALAVDLGVADIRNVLTTGRIWANDAQAPLRIVQFSAPANGLLQCVSDVLLDEEWFATQAQRVETSRANVARAARQGPSDHWAPALRRVA